MIQEEPIKALTYFVLVMMLFHISTKIFTILRDIDAVPQVVGQRRKLGETIEKFNDRVWEEKWPIVVQSLWLLVYIIIFNVELVVALADFGVDSTGIHWKILEKMFCNTCVLGFVGIALVLWLRRGDAEIIG